MLKYRTGLVVLMSFFVLLAQKTTAQDIPYGINYQTIARDGSGNPLVSTGVTITLRIQNSSSTIRWEEDHATATNAYGLVNLVMGTGTKTAGTAPNFEDIDWSAEELFLEVEADASLIGGAVRFESVPYTMLAKNALSLNGDSISTNPPSDGNVLVWSNTNQAWEPQAAGSGWGLLGNAGTVNGTNFIGTTDAQELDFRVNNTLVGRFTEKGQFEQLNNGSSVFIGIQAGDLDDLTANRNVYIGETAGRTGTSANNNVGIGYQSLTSITTGTENSALGYMSLRSLANGGQNVAVGFDALSNTTADQNTAVGAQSGVTNVGGAANTFIGSGADATVAGLNNATAIGANASVATSNSLVLGNNANVGIGTASPNNLLDIEGNSAGSTPMIQLYQAGTGDASLNFSLVSTNRFTIGMDQSDAEKFKISTSSIAEGDLFVITNNGRIGVGQANPKFKFDVGADARVGFNGNADTIILVPTDFVGMAGPSGSHGRWTVGAGSGMSPNGGNGDFVANVKIPVGYRAIQMEVFCTGGGFNVTANTYRVNNGINVNTHGVGFVNAPIGLGPPVEYVTDQYLAIEVTGNLANGADIITGGFILIEPIP